MIKKNDHIAVGVSGGKDSLVLLYSWISGFDEEKGIRIVELNNLNDLDSFDIEANNFQKREKESLQNYIEI